MIRRTCYFTGRVQGVGFRATAAHIARNFSVAGFVRNLTDGSVELVAEGEQSDIDKFIDEINRQMKQNIKNSFGPSEPATGEFGKPEGNNFTILY